MNNYLKGNSRVQNFNQKSTKVTTSDNSRDRRTMNFGGSKDDLSISKKYEKNLTIDQTLVNNPFNERRGTQNARSMIGTNNLGVS
jgi:hypothetical protein